jgi:HD domain
MYHVGPSQLAQMLYVVGQAGSERSAAARMRAAAGIALTGGKSVEARFLAHCAVTRQVSRRIGLHAGVGEALSHTFVRWDGKGVPRRIASKDVPMSVRLMQLADFAEVHHRLHGIEGAVGMARRRAGKLLWPELVKTFCVAAPELLRDLDETTWDRVIAAEPSPRPPLTEQEFDSVLEVIADIADLKSPWLSGHSRGVADLAARAVQAAGVPERDVVTTRRAGLVHDLGRTAISNSVWDKREALTEGDRERVRLHAYYTERMLRRPVALAGLAAVASSHHERLDGSGTIAPPGARTSPCWAGTWRRPTCTTRCWRSVPIGRRWSRPMRPHGCGPRLATGGWMPLPWTWCSGSRAAGARACRRRRPG